VNWKIVVIQFVAGVNNNNNKKTTTIFTQYTVMNLERYVIAFERCCSLDPYRCNSLYTGGDHHHHRTDQFHRSFDNTLTPLPREKRESLGEHNQQEKKKPTVFVSFHPKRAQNARNQIMIAFVFL
jgi:hypothetical protein